MKREEFLLKAQRLMFEIERLASEYGEDNVISLVVLGCIENNHEDGIPRLSAIYNYNIEDQQELDTIFNFVDATWIGEPLDNSDEDNFNDLDGMLGDLGIELE